MNKQHACDIKTICGIVTLYDPPQTCLSNIDTYIKYIDKLYIVDNSHHPDTSLHQILKKRFSNLEILSSGTNLGIATALNLGIRHGLKESYEWLLTMDQDSYFEEGEAEKLFLALTVIDKKTTAILSPSHSKINAESNRPTFEKQYEVMTSGNLLNLNLTQKIGGFNEQLFIDSVDHDYGLRANFSGFYVLQMNNCFLQHTIGKTYSGSAFFTSKQKIFSIHNPKRLYFIVRNGFYIARKYKKQFPKYTREIKSYINKKISYYIKYAPQKRIYIKYILKGIIDYKTNRFGNRVNI